MLKIRDILSEKPIKEYSTLFLSSGSYMSIIENGNMGVIANTTGLDVMMKLTDIVPYLSEHFPEKLDSVDTKSN